MMESVGGWGKIFPDRPDNGLIIAAQTFVRDRLAKKWLPMFLSSDQFAELIQPSLRMVDAAEAIQLSRQRRNQRLMKVRLTLLYHCVAMRCFHWYRSTVDVRGQMDVIVRRNHCLQEISTQPDSLVSVPTFRVGEE